MPELYVEHALLGRGTVAEPFRVTPAKLDYDGAWLREVTTLSRENWATETSRPGVDLRRGVVATPAFVDGHVHLSLSGLRGVSQSVSGAGDALVEETFFAFERHLDADAVRALARMGAYEALLQGTACVWDHYYHADAVREALEDVGLPGVVAPTFQDASGPHQAQLDSHLKQLDTLRTRAACGTLPTALAVGPHATDTVSAASLRALFDYAASVELPVHMHLAQSAQEVTCVQQRDGMTPFEAVKLALRHAQPPSLLLAHALYDDGTGFELLRQEACVRWVSCPLSQSIFAFPAAVEAWEASAAPWGIGTDCVASNDAACLLAEARALQLASRVRAHTLSLNAAAERRETVFREHASEAWSLLSPERLFRGLGPWAAELHPGLKAGVLESGALASWCLWDLDHPALWPAQPAQIVQAIIGARPVLALKEFWVAGRRLGGAHWRDDLVHSEGYRRARTEATAQLKRLLSR